MVTVCAYCNTILRPASEPDEPVNHGICETCHTRFLSLLGVNIARYLDLLDAPVVLVDEEARILSANHLARGLFEIPAGTDSNPRLCGNVFACENAGLPGGCGQTVQCSGCAIRNTVMETHRTGAPVDRRPAVLTRRLRGIRKPARSLHLHAKRGAGGPAEDRAGRDRKDLARPYSVTCRPLSPPRASAPLPSSWPGPGPSRC